MPLAATIGRAKAEIVNVRCAYESGSRRLSAWTGGSIGQHRLNFWPKVHALRSQVIVVIVSAE